MKLLIFQSYHWIKTSRGYKRGIHMKKTKKKRKSPRITIKIHGDLNMDKLVGLFKIANGHSSY